MTGLGLVFALVLYIFAPWLADLSGVGKDLIPIMQSLAWAVLIFPSMSVIRGFFQGMNNLKPYAMSQIAEQVIRVNLDALSNLYHHEARFKRLSISSYSIYFCCFCGNGS